MAKTLMTSEVDYNALGTWNFPIEIYLRGTSIGKLYSTSFNQRKQGLSIRIFSLIRDN